MSESINITTPTNAGPNTTHTPHTPAAHSRRGLALLWAVTILLSAAMLASVAPRALRAQRTSQTQLAAASSLARSASELARLRAESPTDRATSEPEPKLATRVSAALAAAGLPASNLAVLSPESESVEPVTAAAAVVRRRATMVLTPVSLPQLGRFLAEWRARSPEWTPTRIDLEPINAGAGPSSSSSSTQPGGDLPLRVTLAVESVRAEARPAGTFNPGRALLHP